MLYFFILGKNPALSAAEIWACANKSLKEAKITSMSGEALVLEVKGEIDAKSFLGELGGTVKIGQVFPGEMRSADELDAGRLAELALSEAPQAGQRAYFGFSLYKLDEKASGQDLKKAHNRLRKLGIEVKRRLKEQGVGSRFVVSRERSLSSVIVSKNKLLGQGAEIVVLAGKGKLCLGKTLEVQKFEEYGLRDYQRPARDMKIGMLPPKLAKIMINLAGADKSQVILDPFCGLGTVLQEALLLGYENVIGSDISKKAVEMTRENLNWIADKFQVPSSKLKVIRADARKISEQLPPNSIDAIVTEPYLGPPLKGSEPEGKIREIIKELSGLYLAAFSQFKKVLKKDGRIAMVFPVFKTNQQSTPHQNKFGAGQAANNQQKAGLSFLPILEEIGKMGFEAINPLPEELGNNLAIQTTPRNSIVYSRPDQKVLREIFIFEKK